MHYRGAAESVRSTAMDATKEGGGRGRMPETRGAM